MANLTRFDPLHLTRFDPFQEMFGNMLPSVPIRPMWERARTAASTESPPK